MKRLHRALIAGATLTLLAFAAVAPSGAQTPENQPAYVVTYIEVAPAAKAETQSLLKGIAQSSRREPGNRRYDVLERIERDNQFAILEAWSDVKAAEAHAGGAAMAAFRDRLKPLQTGHYDTRPSTQVVSATGAGPVARGSVYTLTHVDVAPPFINQTIELMRKLAEEARKEPNFEAMAAWQQTNRGNHFTLVAIWKDRESLEAHNLAPATKEFREQVGPLIGALYDERLYTGIE